MQARSPVSHAPDAGLPVVRSFTPGVMRDVREGKVYLYEDGELFRAIEEITLRFVGERARDWFGVEAGADLARLHERLTRQQMAEIVRRAHTRRRDIAGIPLAVSKSIARDGLADRTLVSFNEHLRLIPPDEGTKTSGVPAHRDSWYSLPKETVNVWMPCTRAPGVGLYPQFFGRRVSIGWREKETHHHKVKGIDFANEPMLAPDVEPGRSLLFCGNQLHRSRPNDSAVTRVSWDYRLLDVEGTAPSLRLHEFVFVDLLLQRPEEPDWFHAETQTRLRKSHRRLWVARGLTGSRRPKLPITKLGRTLKNALPGVFYG